MPVVADIVQELVPDLVALEATRIGAILAGGLAGILVAERRRLRGLTRTVLFVRWRTWLIAAPMFLFAVSWSTGTALALVLALAMQGTREYAQLVGLPGPYRLVLLSMAATALPVALVSPALWPWLPGIVVGLVTLVPLLMGDVDHGARHLALTSLGFALLPWTLGFLLILRERFGAPIVLAIGTGVALSDVLAWATGSLVGHRPLAPALSPRKTREGLIGTVVGALIGYHLLASSVPLPGRSIAGIALPLAIAVGATWGDLLESLLKRSAGVKDAGNWLPGFGGLLDRIDSLIGALPICFLALEVLT